MNYFIFTDIDGTLLDYKDYSIGKLKSYINKLKKKNSIIFNTSKTFEEILTINKRLDLNFPFIVENGACIFFPSGYLEEKFFNQKNFFKYKNFICYKLSKMKLDSLNKMILEFKSKYNFTFYTELSEKKISSITNLKINDVKNSKQRLFSNPIYWNDSKLKLDKFKKDVKLLNKNLKIIDGGRFIHIVGNYDKALALKQFLKIVKPFIDHKFLTISLGDSENDICMIESTDYGCIIKREKNKLSLKKTNNIFYSKKKAPDGWQESLDHVIYMEKKNF